MAVNCFLQKPNKRMSPVIDFKNSTLLIVASLCILNENKYLEGEREEYKVNKAKPTIHTFFSSQDDMQCKGMRSRG